MPTNTLWRRFTCAALLLVTGSACGQDRGVPPDVVEAVGSYGYRAVRDPMDDRILSECVVGVGRVLERAREAPVQGSGRAKATAGDFLAHCVPAEGMEAARQDTLPTLRFRCPDLHQREVAARRAPLARLWEGTRSQLEVGLRRAHTVELTVPGRPPAHAVVQIRFDADSARVWPHVLHPAPGGTAYVLSIPPNRAADFQQRALGARRIRVRIRGEAGAVHTMEFNNHRLRQALGHLQCEESS